MDIGSLFGGGGLGSIGKMFSGGGLDSIGKMFSGGGLGKIGEMLQGLMGMLKGSDSMSGQEQNQASSAVNQAQQSNASQGSGSGNGIEDMFKQFMQTLLSNMK